jgi:hypothetical protein
MGYHVKITDCKMNLKSLWFEDACRELLDKNFLENEDNMSGVAFNGDEITSKYYAWVDMKKLEDCIRSHNLIGVFQCFGFSVEVHQGNIIGLGYNQKSGDQERLLNELREYFDEGDFIEFEGEEGEKWRYSFSNTYMYVLEPIIVWSVTEIFK